MILIFFFFIFTAYSKGASLQMVELSVAHLQRSTLPFHMIELSITHLISTILFQIMNVAVFCYGIKNLVRSF